MKGYTVFYAVDRNSFCRVNGCGQQFTQVMNVCRCVCVHVYGVCMRVVSFDYLTECAKPNETLIIHLVGQIVSSEMTTLPSEPWS